VLGQPDAVAEQRALGERRGRVDRQHRDRPALGAARLGQRGDERRLAGPGRAGQADERGLAGVGIDLADDLPALGLVVLDERDRTRERALVACEEASARVPWSGMGRGFWQALWTVKLSPAQAPVTTGPKTPKPPPEWREPPPPLRGGPRAFLRFARRNRLLSRGYLILIVRLGWYKLRFRGRLKTDGLAFICPA
jgi:hypothetical protein